ncbi:MAG: NFACT RNA binding domain-containing protein [Candidatus Pacearchaeota archaeon]
MNQYLLNKSYEKYRWFFTSSKTLVVGGKSDKQNELVIREFLKPNYTVMHTNSPGSPFCIILSDKPTKKDLNETAVFCASFSQDWKKGKKEILVDIFKGNQIYKNKMMKTGTFGVKGKIKNILVKPELAIVIQKGKIRAVPRETKEEVIAYIKQGKLSKEEATNKILSIIKDKYQLAISKDEIMQAIPSNNLSVKEV